MVCLFCSPLLQGGSKLRPQDVAEWQAFQQQLQWPPDVRQAWAAQAAHNARLASEAQQHCQQLSQQPNSSHQQELQQQQQYEDEFEDDGGQLEYDEGGSWHLQHTSLQQQQQPVQDDELLCQEGMPDDEAPCNAAAIAAAAAAAAAASQLPG